MLEYNKKDLEIWGEVAGKLSGKSKRTFMAQVVARLGCGGQRFVQRELGWCRTTIQKGARELNGEDLEGDLSARGRKRSEARLPDLLEDIKLIIEPIAQTDPSFRSEQLYSPITAKEVHRRLIDDKNYNAKTLPCVRTISTKINESGFRFQKIQKSKPLKKNP